MRKNSLQIRSNLFDYHIRLAIHKAGKSPASPYRECKGVSHLQYCFYSWARKVAELWCFRTNQRRSKMIATFATEQFDRDDMYRAS